MPILAVLDETAHAALDDSLKTLYKQNTENKNFYLDISPDEAAKVAFNLQSQFDNKKAELTKKHTELNELRAKVAGFDALGMSSDEIKAALASKQPADVQALQTKHETEMSNLRKSFEPITAANEKMKAQIQQSLSQAEISRLITAHGLDPETAPAILRDYVRTVPKAEGSDEYHTQVYLNNEPALVAGQPMTTDQLIKSFQEGKKFSGMFLVGNGAGTGGMRQSQTIGNSIVLDREAVKNNPGLYEAAKADAEKSGKTVTFAAEK